ncbi:BZ3500_MvSof-1268-A1-R1_Chr12-2g03739 [Microbotryum saponariae]|uniref:BZ3500_MvSof-1268-A1-R1_Chr12-2g03739 protein n=1 Tax=Microbotryum saponariae TaxID=289078 RepID=A0A2X0KKH1_9BASI|nr:BZ3500_MvSof-1268-A1-R1_Chr12-2g03739 [Microbotryum saponariae]SDA05327.1 BZ3501_MvSof-1269-A2-R1_Chr12-1g03311 [Microbotryum saponariae]
MTRIENLPQHNAQYGTQAYWDERYSNEAEDASFDWFQTIDLVPLVQRFVPDTNAKICMLGCGNSRKSIVSTNDPDMNLKSNLSSLAFHRRAVLSANLYDKGYHSIVNLDYSPILIDKMEKMNSATRPEMTCKFFIRQDPIRFGPSVQNPCPDLRELIRTLRAGARLASLTGQTADVRALPFADESFDVCIDKGTMDAMMTSIRDPWNPPDQVIKDCNDEIDQVVRVLSKPNGVFLYLTWGQPHFRKQYLLREGWQLETVELGDGFCYYLYVLRRKDRDDRTKAP